MKYHDIVAHNLRHNLCPFCAMPQELILEKSDFFFVTLARAPYTKDHLLVIPNRHIVLFNDLSREEIQDLMYILNKWTEKLHKKYSDINLLLRDGFVGGTVGKSVDHMHFHLIPNLPIGHEEKSGTDREYFSEKKYRSMIQSLKKSFKKF
ncbi:MAG: hypothetical protein DLD55_05665 [candidate division SR1 bacterium]|nr:MAG: hypothetical protein DLD55_05665 [candidate division SR1 bacterium]